MTTGGGRMTAEFIRSISPPEFELMVEAFFKPIFVEVFKEQARLEAEIADLTTRLRRLEAP